MASPSSYPPVPADLTEPGTQKVSRPWLAFFQNLSTQAAAAGPVTGPATSLIGQIALFANLVGTKLSGLVGSGIVLVTSSVASVLAFPADATKFLNGAGAFTVPPGTGITTTGSPASGNLTKFSGATSVTNADLTGDITTTGTVATALSTTGVAASTYGDATHVAQFTVDTKGRLSAASSVAISGGGAIGGGADYSGAGHPQSVQTATGGQTYRDTTNGLLYLHLPAASSNTGWYLMQVAGAGLGWQPEWFAYQANAAGTSGIQAIGIGGTATNQSGSTTATTVYDTRTWRRSATTATTPEGVALTFATPYIDWGFDLDAVFHVRTDPTTLASIRYYIGFGAADPSGDTAGARSIMFRYSTNAVDGGWVGVTHDGTTQSVTATVATIAVATEYKLRIRKVGGTVYFSVNDGAEVSKATNIPASGTRGYGQVYLSALAGTKNLDFAQMSCQLGT